ncbi:MAG: hypothetical protein LBJ00_05060 [Planctomycetaceae bacterium]|nr:hypothetical protein [Planctomycetaceae bacterium]
MCMHPVYSSCLKSLKLNTQAQQREAVVQGQSLPPYQLRYKLSSNSTHPAIKYKTVGLSKRADALFLFWNRSCNRRRTRHTRRTLFE